VQVSFAVRSGDPGGDTGTHGHRRCLQVLWKEPEDDHAVAVLYLPYAEVPGEVGPAGAGDLASFRREFYRCLTARADALFELTDAVWCSAGPVRTLVELSLCPEHRRGHGAPYDGLGCGAINIKGLQFAIATQQLPRGVDGPITLAVAVSPWPRPDAPSSAQPMFCHVPGRGKNRAQMVPGWPYSVIAALEPGRTSWPAVPDEVGRDPTTTKPR
jgi:hypothetical protein